MPTHRAPTSGRPAVRAVLGAAAVALLAAGIVGAVEVRRPAPAATAHRVTAPATAHRRAPATNVVTPSTPSAPPTSAAAAPPADLAARLLVPDDLGGYYRPDPAVAAVDLGGSACLAALDGPGRPDAHAATYLAVGNLGDVPALLELVDDYPTAAATGAAYAADAADLRRCATLATTLAGGVAVTTRLLPLELAPIGSAAIARQGTFVADGLAESLRLAVVAGPGEVLVLVEVDRDPPVPGSAIYDNFPSAVVTAYGKLA